MDRELMDLICLNCGNLLVLLHIITNLFRPLLQSALRDGFCHCWNFDDGVGIGSELLDNGKGISQLRRAMCSQNLGSKQDATRNHFVFMFDEIIWMDESLMGEEKELLWEKTAKQAA
jgi:hypothetical protein